MKNYFRIYTCCPSEGCGAHREVLSMLHRHGIEASPKFDKKEHAHYLAYSPPLYMPIEDVRKLNLEISKKVTEEDKSCFCCHGVNCWYGSLKLADPKGNIFYCCAYCAERREKDVRVEVERI